MTTASGLISLIAQTPAGAVIDATNAMRSVVTAALAALALGALVILVWPTFWPVMIANSALVIVGDVFGPAVAALTLGLYPKAALPVRMGRNAAFDHIGNVALAVAAGAVGWAFGRRAVFLLVPVFAVLSIDAALAIPAAAIDNEGARGASEAKSDASCWSQLSAIKG